MPRLLLYEDSSSYITGSSDTFILKLRSHIQNSSRIQNEEMRFNDDQGT